ncbi:MAG: hypothetical protein JSU83_01300 [Deltaproteobacteria bacterium]|nr:MAG: hypothetical protein JSU83_01300 [Deltaproteobacteria bacterium]
MKNFVKLSLICLLLGMAACAPTKIWTSDPLVQSAENPHYNAKFEPMKNGNNYFNSFRLVFTNKSDKDLTIDWNKTRYLYNNKAYGRFVFAGVDEKNVNNLPPDTVPSGGSLTKIVSPLKMIAWKPLQARHVDTPGFSRGPIPEGQSGILLVVSWNSQEIRERITLNIEIKKEK